MTQSHFSYTDCGERQACLQNVKRVVLKIGTRLLMDVKDQEPAERVRQLVAQIDALRKRGLEVILVTSGAIGAAIRILGVARRPKKMAACQAFAALGQCHLMALYEEACASLGFHCAQLLLTAADLHDRERQLKVTQCIDELLASGILPVINENDSVSVDEIKVGDNDTLAALVACMTRADLTVLLTTIDGMKERDPETGALGKRLSVVTEISHDVLAMANGTDGNQFSVGGMLTKLQAAIRTTTCGDPLWIAEAFDFDGIRRVFQAEDVGTLFLPAVHERLHARQRFLAFFSEPAGELIIDDGAEDALCNKGKSLLPGGVIGLRGIFPAGATVRISNTRRQELARGTVNFSAEELSKICGAATKDLETILGHKPAATEAVHRNALVLTPSR